MTRQVVDFDLYACWWIASSTRSAAAWKMVPSCIFWCLWRKKYDALKV